MCFSWGTTCQIMMFGNKWVTLPCKFLHCVGALWNQSFHHRVGDTSQGGLVFSWTFSTGKGRHRERGCDKGCGHGPGGHVPIPHQPGSFLMAAGCPVLRICLHGPSRSKLEEVLVERVVVPLTKALQDILGSQEPFVTQPVPCGTAALC